MNTEKTDRDEVDALCKECGHAFKVFVDRVTHSDPASLEDIPGVECPVCGCGKCRIGR
ncbi:MAG: hypothetical protein HY895_08805 [Deltaproteobacteria bacterium]|nr:hypothetical protein [Deltaproteobacteria bacterium]